MLCKNYVNEAVAHMIIITPTGRIKHSSGIQGSVEAH